METQGRLLHVHDALFGHTVELGTLTIIALITLAVTTLINCAAVSVSGQVASFITVLKVLLVLGVGIAAFFYQGGDWGHFGMARHGPVRRRGYWRWLVCFWRGDGGRTLGVRWLE